MIAIWSFWTKPHKMKEGSLWPTTLHFLSSWILSFQTAKKHFKRTALYTDYEGAKLLVDKVKLDFDEVHIELDQLDKYSAEWWAVGKIYTYSLQQSSFVHIDNDVYLWQPLPKKLIAAPLFAQNPEHFEQGHSWYHPEKFDDLSSCKGFVPKEVLWYKSQSIYQKAVCCGIFGGNDIKFVNYYCHQANRVITNPVNQLKWAKWGGDNILIEQYILSACIEYHKNRKKSPFRGINIEYLFNSSREAFDPSYANKAGYTHLIGGAKRNRVLARALIKKTINEYPNFFENSKRYLRDNGGGGSGLIC